MLMAAGMTIQLALFVSFLKKILELGSKLTIQNFPITESCKMILDWGGEVKKLSCPIFEY